jgi:hypothetical protein
MHKAITFACTSQEAAICSIIKKISYLPRKKTHTLETKVEDGALQKPPEPITYYLIVFILCIGCPFGGTF